MRFTIAHASIVSSVVLLSGCYANGKFHTPGWSDVTWWKKDKAANTALAGGPSGVPRPSEEATLAARGSPGETAGTAPLYDGAPASFTGNPYPDASPYPNTGAAPLAAAGRTWAPSNEQPATNAAPYNSATPNAATGGAPAYATGGRYDAQGGAGIAQTSPYGAYPNPNSYGSAGPAADLPRDDSAAHGQYSNPHYNASAPPAAATGYTAAPPAAAAAPTAREAIDRYATDPNRYAGDANRFDARAYRDANGTPYANERIPAAGAPNDATAARTASRDDHREGAYNHPDAIGATGYAGQPNSYSAAPSGVDSRNVAPYRPGGTSQYDPAAASTASGINRGAAPVRYDGPASFENRYADPSAGGTYHTAPAPHREDTKVY